MSDPLEDVLHLEDRFYREGYQQGLDDGAKAGRVEGRCFGMEKGFEKFLEGGRLAGKAIVWANRLPSQGDEDDGNDDAVTDRETETCRGDKDQPHKTGPPTRCALPPLPDRNRIDKHVRALYALVEPGTLSTENTDEAVQNFDNRIKRAQGKAKVVERIAG
ncbi:hypothetical protein L249_2001 [Ophiocordyceps polyrhachis-furcata BCC 54312]|uniref:Essential protein Yae1 N-terminal domain-containing protein n=1 Tax=Ophiocordyceps polyrhachis-furcata BCC 54312 TaxID=1330021 RepID=A0A367LQI9_9HYPO|nr:hypothetical protein L249_2001 [Ophiocordyceps polyrhachis-furcata BCC 54312]